jgi:hypothetical protein
MRCYQLWWHAPHGSVPAAGVAHVHAARRRLSAEAIQQLVTGYQAGVPSTQLARRYGISKGAVLRLLRDREVPVRLQRITGDDVQEAIQLYRAGNSLAVTGAKLAIARAPFISRFGDPASPFGTVRGENVDLPYRSAHQNLPRSLPKAKPAAFPRKRAASFRNMR